jgi:acyl-CoA thioesterase II
MTTVGDPLGRFLASLELEARDDGFRGTTPAGRRQRTFGGLVMGQALVAAARTLDGAPLPARSLHTVFVRAGDPGQPIEFSVERVSDGRVFAIRRLTARQGEATLFHAFARFGFDAPGPAFQMARPPAGLPAPASLPDFPTHLAPHRELVPDWADGDVPIDARVIDEPSSTSQLMWFRAAGALGDEAIIHACMLLYASDMTLLGVAARPHGHLWSDPGVIMASLDHTIWFHGPCRADEWLLYEQRAMAHASSLALVTGSIYAGDGHLMASVAQDGLVRLPSV